MRSPSGQHQQDNPLETFNLPPPPPPPPPQYPPSSVDLTQFDPPVGDQGPLDSCQSWAMAYSLLRWYAAKGGYYPPGPDGGGFAPAFVYTYTPFTRGAIPTMVRQRAAPSRP